jgi:glycosyltransferase involved in cell wall biosynthesis
MVNWMSSAPSNSTASKQESPVQTLRDEVVPPSNPAVSVLIPTYNYASYLPEAIESVLAQDFQDFELLILDDCSSDNTAAVVKPYCARDPRIHFEVNPANLGMVANWNECLRRARGTYMKFLFGDDTLCDPQAITKMVRLLESNPSAVLATSARMILDEKSRVMEVWRTLPEGCHDGREIMARCLMEIYNFVGEPSSVLFRKKDARRGFDPAYRQWVDVEMWLHLLEHGDLAYTREPLCSFRRHCLQQTAINQTNGIPAREWPLILRAYLGSARFPRKLGFTICHRLRRSRRGGSLDVLSPAELAELEERLLREMGGGWYFLHWCGFIIKRPFENLAHSVRKRWPWRRLPKPSNLPALRG